MAKAEKAALDGKAGSGVHRVNLTVLASTASMDLNSPPYEQSGAASDMPSYAGGAVGGTAVGWGGCVAGAVVGVAAGVQAARIRLATTSRPAIRVRCFQCFIE